MPAIIDLETEFPGKPRTSSEPQVNDEARLARANQTEREIRYEYSNSLTALLGQLRASLLISTYQAGKLAVVGTQHGQLGLTFHNFDRPMGMAVDGDCLAVASREGICLMRKAPDLGPRLEPVGTHDGCYLTRQVWYTGDIQAHDVAWCGGELWIVNTLFSCLSTLSATHSFLPRWRPPFITALAAEDRCHLNGLAMADGRPQYVSVLAQTDTPHGWRPTKANSGCVIDVDSGEVMVRGLSMPHSPRLHQGRLWLLDSGTGRLVTVDPANRAVDCVAELPGYGRGLALVGDFAFIGLSLFRESATFGGLPLESRRKDLKCGVVVVQLSTGRQVAFLEFRAGIEEVFDVRLVQGSIFVALRGPHSQVDGQHPIWYVPESH